MVRSLFSCLDALVACQGTFVAPVTMDSYKVGIMLGDLSICVT